MIRYFKDFLTMFGSSDAGQLKSHPDIMITVQFGHWALSLLTVFVLVDLGLAVMTAAGLSIMLWALKQFVMDWWFGQRNPNVLWDSIVDNTFHVLGTVSAVIALLYGWIAAVSVAFVALFGFYINYRTKLISSRK